MAHGGASGKKMIGASAVHAAASEFLFRGYNVAFPEFDMGREDDLLVYSPDSREIGSVQVRSKQTNRNAAGDKDGYSTPVIMPTELTDPDGHLDYLVIALRYCSQWMLGLFDCCLMKAVMDGEVGSYTSHVGQQTFEPRARIERMSGRVIFSGVEVSSAFSHVPDSKWDQMFPVRIKDVKPPLNQKIDLYVPRQRHDIKPS